MSQVGLGVNAILRFNAGRMVVFVAILSLIFFGMLVALSVITPSWRWVLLFIAALFACQIGRAHV